MPIIATIIAAIIPTVTYLIIIWKMDSYEREPLKFVIVHFVWGAVGAIIFTISVNQFLSSEIFQYIQNPTTHSLIESIVLAPFVEELMKGLFLLFTITSRKFDNITDGLVYGGAIGLGFGMTENFFYFLAFGTTPDTWINLVFIRSGFSAVMHCIATASLGALLGIAKFSLGKKKFILPIAGLFIAIFIHFLWNLSVSFESTYLFGFLFMIFAIIFFIVLFKVSINNEKRIIFDELEEESISYLIPKDHLKILSSDKRNRKDWINEKIRKKYIKAATKLAFRKFQFKNSSGRKKDFYRSEVEKCRSLITELNISD
jgi:RsiW-degrading membrane proteinase PrsW (M82 family)